MENGHIESFNGRLRERDGNDLQARGLYLDEPPWRAHAFAVTKGQDG